MAGKVNFQNEETVRATILGLLFAEIPRAVSEKELSIVYNNCEGAPLNVHLKLLGLTLAQVLSGSPHAMLCANGSWKYHVLSNSAALANSILDRGGNGGKRGKSSKRGGGNGRGGGRGGVGGGRGRGGYENRSRPGVDRASFDARRDRTPPRDFGADYLDRRNGATSPDAPSDISRHRGGSGPPPRRDTDFRGTPEHGYSLENNRASYEARREPTPPRTFGVNVGSPRPMSMRNFSPDAPVDTSRRPSGSGPPLRRDTDFRGSPEHGYSWENNRASYEARREPTPPRTFGVNVGSPRPMSMRNFSPDAPFGYSNSGPPPHRYESEAAGSYKNGYVESHEGQSTGFRSRPDNQINHSVSFGTSFDARRDSSPPQKFDSNFDNHGRIDAHAPSRQNFDERGNFDIGRHPTDFPTDRRQTQITQVPHISRGNDRAAFEPHRDLSPSRNRQAFDNFSPNALFDSRPTSPPPRYVQSLGGHANGHFRAAPVKEMEHYSSNARNGRASFERRSDMSPPRLIESGYQRNAPPRRNFEETTSSDIGRHSIDYPTDRRETPSTQMSHTSRGNDRAAFEPRRDLSPSRNRRAFENFTPDAPLAFASGPGTNGPPPRRNQSPPHQNFDQRASFDVDERPTFRATWDNDFNRGNARAFSETRRDPSPPRTFGATAGWPRPMNREVGNFSPDVPFGYSNSGPPPHRYESEAARSYMNGHVESRDGQSTGFRSRPDNQINHPASFGTSFDARRDSTPPQKFDSNFDNHGRIDAHAPSRQNFDERGNFDIGRHPTDFPTDRRQTQITQVPHMSRGNDRAAFEPHRDLSPSRNRQAFDNFSPNASLDSRPTSPSARYVQSLGGHANGHSRAAPVKEVAHHSSNVRGRSDMLPPRHIESDYQRNAPPRRNFDETTSSDIGRHSIDSPIDRRETPSTQMSHTSRGNDRAAFGAHRNLTPPQNLKAESDYHNTGNTGNGAGSSSHLRESWNYNTEPSNRPVESSSPVFSRQQDVAPPPSEVSSSGPSRQIDENRGNFDMAEHTADHERRLIKGIHVEGDKVMDFFMGRSCEPSNLPTTSSGHSMEQRNIEMESSMVPTMPCHPLEQLGFQAKPSSHPSAPTDRPNEPYRLPLFSHPTDMTSHSIAPSNPPLQLLTQQIQPTSHSTAPSNPPLQLLTQQIQPTIHSTAPSDYQLQLLTQQREPTIHSAAPSAFMMQQLSGQLESLNHPTALENSRQTIKPSHELQQFSTLSLSPPPGLASRFDFPPGLSRQQDMVPRTEDQPSSSSQTTNHEPFVSTSMPRQRDLALFEDPNQGGIAENFGPDYDKAISKEIRNIMEDIEREVSFFVLVSELKKKGYRFPDFPMEQTEYIHGLIVLYPKYLKPLHCDLNKMTFRWY